MTNISYSWIKSIDRYIFYSYNSNIIIYNSVIKNVKSSIKESIGKEVIWRINSFVLNLRLK